MTASSLGTTPPAGVPDGTAAASLSAASEPTGPTGPTSPTGLGLAPLREALLARARATAADLVAEARTEHDDAVAEAEHEVAERLAVARRQGRTDGEELLAADRAAARAADRARLLAAERAVYESLRSTCRERVRDLLSEPGARDRLAAAVRGRLGPEATVEPTPDGGVAARTPDARSVDASVSALVDSALAGHDLSRLWTRG
jgi:hypothetical protein